MSNLSNEIPTDINLYHYTSRAGLLGMVSSKSLWLTNISYMNDSQEYIYALKTIKDFIKDNYDDYLLQYVNLRDTNIPEIPSVFTFSLSEQKDSLSQWRGYCPNGGVCISFKKELLNQMLKDNKLQIGKCLYDTNEIENLISQQIVGMNPEEYKKVKEVQRSRGTTNYSSGLPFGINQRIFQNLPFIKHHSFKDEQE